MASLANQTISSTYDGLIKTSSDNAVPVSGVQALEDGSGNALALSVGRSGNGVTVTGSLNATLATAAQPNVTSVGTLSSLSVGGNITVSNNSSVTIDVSDADFPFIGATGSSNDDLIVGSWGDVIINSDYNNSSAQNIIFKEGNSELMRVDSAGNLGIGGIADADFRLHIYKSTNAEMAFESTGSGGGFFRIGTGATGSGFDGAFRIYDINAGAERMRIDSSGNVGIGTTGGSGRLNIGVSNASAVRVAEFFNSQLGSSFSAGSFITLGRADISRSMDVGIYGNGSNEFDGKIVVNETGGSLILGTVGTERMRILSSGGITFNGDTSTANALDDYEEGTWTPSLLNVTVSYTQQSGTYTKIGNRVFFEAYIEYNTLDTTDVSSLSVGTLPFNSGNTRMFIAHLIPYTSTGYTGGANDNVTAYIESTFFTFVGMDGSINYRYNSGKFATSGQLRFAGSYKV